MIKNLKRTYIIAEIGVNHNGSLALAKRLIDKAKIVGADCVKFQLFKSENLVQKNTPLANYQKENIKSKISQAKMLKNLELNFNQIKILLSYSKKKKIDFLCTPYNLEDLKVIKKLNLSAVKLSSMHATEDYFISEALRLNKLTLIPTGMCNDSDIQNLKRIISKSKNKKICIMQCNTNYPTKLNDANINVLKYYKKLFPKLLLGFSDHTQDFIAACSSISLGAKIIEKHFTLSNKMKGPDHIASLNPKNFKIFVKNIRDTETSLGSIKKRITESEKINLNIVKRSIVSKTFIKKGSRLRVDKVTFKRTLNGIPVGKLSTILNKKIKKNILPNTLLKKSFFK